MKHKEGKTAKIIRQDLRSSPNIVNVPMLDQIENVIRIRVKQSSHQGLPHTRFKRQASRDMAKCAQPTVQRIVLLEQENRVLQILCWGQKESMQTCRYDDEEGGPNPLSS
uniref:Uncharacterized protein n=1 Tax=Ditylenchus dipsaci TaxID=166011 RepID=A0A915CQG6_9BILA